MGTNRNAWRNRECGSNLNKIKMKYIDHLNDNAESFFLPHPKEVATSIFGNYKMPVTFLQVQDFLSLAKENETER